MPTRILLLVAALLASASAAPASAPPTPDFDPTLVNRPPAYTQVAVRTLKSASAALGERIPQNSDAWMLLNRPVPGNAGDTSYGGDWATTWGD